MFRGKVNCNRKFCFERDFDSKKYLVLNYKNNFIIKNNLTKFTKKKLLQYKRYTVKELCYFKNLFTH
jgi:hypothetical protein